jgi:ankyrin repeat protein
MFRFEDYEEFFMKKNVYYTKVEENMFDLVHRGNYEAVYSRIKKGTSINLRNDQDQTLLHYAVLYNQIEIVKLLISFRADLDAKDKFGQTVRDVIQKYNPELYSQLEEYTGDFLQLQGEQEIMETHVVGSAEDSSCCIT